MLQTKQNEKLTNKNSGSVNATCTEPLLTIHRLAYHSERLD